MNILAISKDYRLAEKGFIEAQGIKTGDTVLITRTAKSREMGWSHSWSPTMDEMVGKRVSVIGPPHDEGDVDGPIIVRHLGTDWIVPFFVLSDRQEPEKVKTIFWLSQEGKNVHLMHKNSCGGPELIMAVIRPDGVLAGVSGGDPDRMRNSRLLGEGKDSGFVIPCGSLLGSVETPETLELIVRPEGDPV